MNIVHEVQRYEYRSINIWIYEYTKYKGSATNEILAQLRKE